jgi:hypothetical protein
MYRVKSGSMKNFRTTASIARKDANATRYIQITA